MAIDPICKMHVDEKTARFTSVYQGKKYYFCAPGCKTRFDENPEKYAEVSEKEGDQSDAACTGMDVREAIHQRRAYRSLAPVVITKDMIAELAEAAQLFCSCFNNQPWRYVFVDDPGMLARMREALSPGNEWAGAASMMIAVLSKPELDCVIKDRKYYLFDTGMATASLILRATELGLVAHPIAGYSQGKTRAILQIPDDMEVITLVIVGRKAPTIGPLLTEKQAMAEEKRPARLPINRIIYHNVYK